MSKEKKNKFSPPKIRKPTAPPSQRHSNKKRELKSDLVGRKAKYGSETGQYEEEILMDEKNIENSIDHFDLKRFLNAQEEVYEQALNEIQAGRKRSHWMWYIFPQIIGLGSSSTTRHYAVKSAEEARAYLDYPILG